METKYFDLREKIETLSADKGYDDIKVIDGLREHGIKAIIDIRNKWQSGESTKQYKNTEIVYTYDGKVGIIDDEGIFKGLSGWWGSKTRKYIFGD